MIIQVSYSLIFIVLIIALLICAIMAHRSDKPVGKFTCLFNVSLISLVSSNLIITNTQNEAIATFGYYLFFISMTIVMMTLASFINVYCRDIDSTATNKKIYILYALGCIDIIQLLLGPIFNHVFSIKSNELDSQIYYIDVPKIGLSIHRIIDYIIFFVIIGVLIYRIIKTSKLYREKYVVILIAMLLAGIAQFVFIFVKTTIDKSVIVHGIFGLFVYYYSIKYRPLRLLDAVLSNIASDMNDAVYVFDSLNKCVWANEQGYKLLDLKPGMVGSVKEAIINLFGDLTNKGDNWTKDIHLKKSNRYYTIEKKSITSNQLLDGSFLIIEDNTERQNKIDKELYSSTHDNLTGLFNMQYLYNYIAETLKNSHDIDYYVIYINIKNFKIINDIFGKKFGDKVLIQLANWFKKNLKHKGTYGRLVGDTFGIFIPIEEFDEELFSHDFSNFIVKDKKIEHKVCLHVGIYQIKDKTMDVSIMFDRAHLALSNINDNYKTIIKYYDENLRNSILEEQQLIANLEEAIKEKQIKPYLQPITDINGKMVGAEVLARWIHPELGFLPPIKFIPVFEKNGLIVDLDKYIWKCACEILSSWKNVHDDLFLSINISPKDFYFIDVVSEIKNLVEYYFIEPTKLRIEITESAMMYNSEEKLKIFDQLRASGFIVEMDDFGSGYSSLNLLKDMPVDVLKLDMKFLSDDKNAKSDTIIKNIINLSNELQMTTLSEGVETRQQFKQLINMGCSLFQGYYFAKPMSLEDFEQFIIDNKR